MLTVQNSHSDLLQTGRTCPYSETRTELFHIAYHRRKASLNHLRLITTHKLFWLINWLIFATKIHLALIAAFSASSVSKLPVSFHFSIKHIISTSRHQKMRKNWDTGTGWRLRFSWQLPWFDSRYGSWRSWWALRARGRRRRWWRRTLQDTATPPDCCRILYRTSWHRATATDPSL